MVATKKEFEPREDACADPSELGERTCIVLKAIERIGLTAGWGVGKVTLIVTPDVEGVPDVTVQIKKPAAHQD